jgi:hypothetical protein
MESVLRDGTSSLPSARRCAEVRWTLLTPARKGATHALCGRAKMYALGLGAAQTA